MNDMTNMLLVYYSPLRLALHFTSMNHRLGAAYGFANQLRLALTPANHNFVALLSQDWVWSIWSACVLTARILGRGAALGSIRTRTDRCERLTFLAQLGPGVDAYCPCKYLMFLWC